MNPFPVTSNCYNPLLPSGSEAATIDCNTGLLALGWLPSTSDVSNLLGYVSTAPAPHNLPGITRLDFGMTILANVIDFRNTTALLTMTFARLTSIGRSAADLAGITLINNTGLATLTAPVLSYADYLLITGNAIALISLPALSTTGCNAACVFTIQDDTLNQFSAPALLAVAGSLTLSSNPLLSSISLTQLATVGGDFLLQHLPLVASLSLAHLVSVGGDFLMSDIATLAAINLVALQSVTGSLTLADLTAPFTTLNLPALTSCGSLVVHGPLLATFTAANLVSVTGNLDLNSVAGGNIYTALSFPALTTCGAFFCTFNTHLITLSFIGAPVISWNISGNDCTALTTVLFGGGATFANGISIDFTNCALTQATVDAILAAAVRGGGFVTGTINLNLGTNSAPSGAGLADVGTLTGRGVTVTVNP